MDPKLLDFKRRYGQWVEESLEDYRAGRVKKIMERYPFMVYEDAPWAPFAGNPKDHTFALVTSGGLYLRDRQEPFETESIHGDPSCREIPRDIRQEDAGFAHSHYDHGLAEQDINCIFPIHRLQELEEEGIIGSLAQTHYSFSYVNDVLPLMEETAPRVVQGLKNEGVTALILVPV
jgi:D-proline reductase (dithiol) PrdB